MAKAIIASSGHGLYRPDMTQLLSDIGVSTSGICNNDKTLIYVNTLHLSAKK